MTEEQKPSEEKKEEVKEGVKEEVAPVAEETKEVKVPAKFESLVGEIEKMSVMDLAELVKILEDKFGVSAAAPVAMMVAPGAAGGDEPAEEKSVFDVELTAVGDNKISVIKAVRAVTELGLKDAKDLVDAAPKIIKEGVAKEEAEKIKKAIEAAGGQADLK